jgi:acyl-CoA synthetase (AMP-forming)/AMP-acid ligase II
VDPTELTQHLRRELAGYKVPKHIYLLESLGRGDNGKIDQLALTRRLAALVESTAE